MRRWGHAYLLLDIILFVINNAATWTRVLFVKVVASNNCKSKIISECGPPVNTYSNNADSIHVICLKKWHLLAMDRFQIHPLPSKELPTQ